MNFTRQNSVATDLAYMNLVDKVFGVTKISRASAIFQLEKPMSMSSKKRRMSIANFVKETEF
jgi:hypothetical protein